MKQALSLTEKHGELNGPEEDAVSTRKGLGNFLDVEAGLPGLGFRNWRLLGCNRHILFLCVSKGLTPHQRSMVVSLSESGIDKAVTIVL